MKTDPNISYTELLNLVKYVKREKTNKMQQSDVYYQLLSNMFWGSYMNIWAFRCLATTSEP